MRRKRNSSAQPLILTPPPGSKWPNERFVLTAAAFELVVANLLYYRNAYPTIPLVIMWAKNGAREPLASVVDKALWAALTRQVATNVAVECRDRPHFRDAAPVSGDVVARTALSGLCDTWAPLGPPLLIPAASTVPTLIFAGAIDPVAEPTKAVASRKSSAATRNGSNSLKWAITCAPFLLARHGSSRTSSRNLSAGLM